MVSGGGIREYQMVSGNIPRLCYCLFPELRIAAGCATVGSTLRTALPSRRPTPGAVVAPPVASLGAALRETRLGSAAAIAGSTASTRRGAVPVRAPITLKNLRGRLVKCRYFTLSSKQASLSIIHVIFTDCSYFEKCCNQYL